MTHHETVLGWLKDAYSMEKGMLPILENHAKDAKDSPQMQAKMQEHVEQTRRHAELVQGCIERLGGDVSQMKTGIATIAGMIRDMPSSVSGDEVVKNVLGDYATEHFEIASYRSLIAGAEAIGDQETVRVCQEILRDEEQMAHFFEQNISMVTRNYLGTQAKTAGGT